MRSPDNKADHSVEGERQPNCVKALQALSEARRCWNNPKTRAFLKELRSYR